MELPYSKGKVYGPYYRKDGRRHVIIVFPDKTRKTVSYPKYSMELKLGRYLGKQEQIHHIDGNPNNDRIENIAISIIGQHQEYHHSNLMNKKYTLICMACKNEFVCNYSSYMQRTIYRPSKSTGYFCSKSCAGKSLGVLL